MHANPITRQGRYNWTILQKSALNIYEIYGALNYGAVCIKSE